jgi:hypothetical protein
MQVSMIKYYFNTQIVLCIVVFIFTNTKTIKLMVYYDH